MRRLFVIVALVGACGGQTPDATDAGDATLDHADAEVIDASDATLDQTDADADECGDACCLKGGAICGTEVDASGCAACCADASHGPIAKTIDFACDFPD